MSDGHSDGWPSRQRPTVMVSGGVDPVHIGHIRMIRDAAKHGDVIVVANSDAWLFRKKGFVFMEWEKRKELLEAIKGVLRVEWVDDSDETVCEAIRRIRPTYFANGGDRKSNNVPEVQVCNELGIELLWNIGGGKIDSSSQLVDKAKQKIDERQGKVHPAGNPEVSDK